MLQINELNFRYTEDSEYLWKPISFKAFQGQLVLIKGANGSGKTTLLNCICGIIPEYITGDLQGSIIFNGENISSTPLRKKAATVNMLFQEPDRQIFMPIVEEEIAFGLENLCLEKDIIRSRIQDALNRLNIEHLRYKKTTELSFGQKKLVVLAGIMAISPTIILIDEFCAGMESKSINDFFYYIQELKKHNQIVVLAEHHNSFNSLADLTINLDEIRL